MDSKTGAKRLYLARRNPATPAEGWPRLWRSHAAFAGQFGSIGSRFTRVLQCSRVLDADLPGASKDYDGVAVLSCPSMEDAHTQLPPDIRVKIDQDELRVFDSLVDGFSMYGMEHVAFDRGFDAARERAGIINFMKARPGVSREALRRAWLEQMGPLIEAAHGGLALRCVLNEIVGQPPAGYDFDAVSEVWYPGIADAVRTHLPGTASAAAGQAGGKVDELRDPSRTVRMFTHITHTWTATAA